MTQPVSSQANPSFAQGFSRFLKPALVALAFSFDSVLGKACLSPQGHIVGVEKDCSYSIPGRGDIKGVLFDSKNQAKDCLCLDYYCSEAAVNFKVDGLSYLPPVNATMVRLGGKQKYLFSVSDSRGGDRDPGGKFYRDRVTQEKNDALALSLGSECISNAIFSYGNYRSVLQLRCPNDMSKCPLPDGLTASVFTYQFERQKVKYNPYHEVDMEIVNHGSNNMQFVVQPWHISSNLHRKRMSLEGPLTVTFNIQANSIEFCMANGELSAEECRRHPDAIVWSYDDTKYIPQKVDGKDPYWRMVFNYWMKHGAKISDQQKARATKAGLRNLLKP